MAHKKPNPRIMVSSHTKLTGVNRRTPTMRAATVMGKTQYPSTQTDWKKLIVPPSNCALIVTMADPTETRTKTEANTRAA